MRRFLAETGPAIVYSFRVPLATNVKWIGVVIGVLTVGTRVGCLGHRVIIDFALMTIWYGDRDC